KNTGRWTVDEWSSRSTRAGTTPESTVNAARPRPRSTTIWDALRRRGGLVDMQGNVPLASRTNEPGPPPRMITRAPGVAPRHEGRHLVGRGVPVVLHRQAAPGGGSRPVRPPRRGRGGVAQLRAR